MLDNECELLVLFDHFLNNVVDLLLLFDVFLVCFSADLFLILDLALDELFVVNKSSCFACNELTVCTVLVLLNLQVGGIDSCVLFKILLTTILRLS